MNTVGKILVILNFLFAVIVGVFLVMHVALSTQWKDAYVALKREADVMKSAGNTNAKATQSVLGDYRNAQLENEKLKQKMKDTETQMQGMEDSYKIKIEELNHKVKDGDISLQEALKAKQRLTDEIAQLNQTIKDRETFIVRLEADVKTINLQARNFEAQAKIGQIRNENLLEQLQESTRKLARIEAGVNPDLAPVRNPNEPNPPTVQVNGVIELVDGKDGLVQISLGTDHGVNKNHTLDVYRVRPEAKYLGMIRIVEAYHHKSVGRLVASGNPALRPQLRTDDLVTSKITR